MVHHLIVSTLLVIILLLFGLGCCLAYDLLAPSTGTNKSDAAAEDLERGATRLLDPSAPRSDGQHGKGEAGGGFLAPLMRVFSGEPPPFSSTASLFAGAETAVAPKPKAKAPPAKSDAAA